MLGPEICVCFQVAGIAFSSLGLCWSYSDKHSAVSYLCWSETWKSIDSKMIHNDCHLCNAQHFRHFFKVNLGSFFHWLLVKRANFRGLLHVALTMCLFSFCNAMEPGRSDCHHCHLPLNWYYGTVKQSSVATWMNWHNIDTVP